MYYMKLLLITLLVIAPVWVSTVFASAQEDAAAAQADGQQQLLDIAETYTAYINELLIMFPNNPELLESLAQILNAMSAINQSVSDSYTAIPTTTLDDYSGLRLFPSDSFGVDSVITSIDVYPAILGNSASLISQSDDNETVTTAVRYTGDDEDAPGDYEAEYTYSKDGVVLESGTEEGLFYGDVLGYVNLIVENGSSTAPTSPTTTAVVEFLLDSKWRDYEKTSGTVTRDDCYADADKDVVDAVLDLMLDSEQQNDRQHIEPIADITEYYTPIEYLDDDDSSVEGCRLVIPSPDDDDDR